MKSLPVCPAGFVPAGPRARFRLAHRQVRRMLRSGAAESPLPRRTWVETSLLARGFGVRLTIAAWQAAVGAREARMEAEFPDAFAGVPRGSRLGRRFLANCLRALRGRDLRPEIFASCADFLHGHPEQEARLLRLVAAGAVPMARALARAA